MGISAAELVFKIQATGTDQLKAVAVAVDGVRQGTALAGAQLKTFDSTLNSLVASGKTFQQALAEMSRSQGVLSNAVRSTAQAMLDQIRAAAGDETSIRKLTGATQELVGANIAAGSALRDLTGQSNIRGIENLLTKTLGLGVAFQSMFVLSGVVAAGEELYRLYEKYDPLQKATRDLAEENKKLDASYEQVTKRIAGYIETQARATLGPAGAKAFESFDVGTQRAEAQAALDNINRQIADKQKQLLFTTRGRSSHGEPAESYQTEDPVVARQIETLQAKAEGVALQIRELDERQKTDDTVVKSDRDKAAAEQAKKLGQEALELIKRRTETERELQKGMEAAQAKELSGYDAIRARLQSIVELKASENTLTAKGLEYITQTAVAENAKYSQSLIDRARKVTAEDAMASVKVEGQDEARGGKYSAEEFLKNLRAEISKEEKELEGLLRSMARGDQADADAVRQRASLAIYENNKGTGSGAHGGAGAANADYQVRINAANELFQIETRHLDLITEEGKREEALADARKKQADEIYSAEREHEEALDALRQKDLDKYHALAESVFDALTDRVHGASFDIRQMLHGAARNLGSQVFANATQKVFQAAGHALGSLSGGSTFGGLLNGTIFDPANKSIEQHTKDTADWLSKIYQLTSGQSASDPSGANPSAAAGSGAVASGVLGNPLTALAAMAAASLPPALGGTGTATTAASAASGLSGFLKAISSPGGGSSAFSTGMSSVLSGGALGNILYGDSTMSRVGSAVGLAGALGTSALGIASGISQGGVAGGFKAAGGAVGAATTLASNIAPLLGKVLPAAIPVIGSVIAAALPLIGSLFGTGPQQRANQITNELAQNAFLPNTALNTIQNTNGTLLSMDAHGLLRQTALNALPTVAEPYITSERLNGSPYRTYQDAPGGVTQGYSGTATGTGQMPVSNAPVVNNHYYISAVDPQSFHEYLQKPANSAAVGDALASHLRTADGQATHAIRFVTGTN